MLTLAVTGESSTHGVPWCIRVSSVMELDELQIRVANVWKPVGTYGSSGMACPDKWNANTSAPARCWVPSSHTQ